MKRFTKSRENIKRLSESKRERAEALLNKIEFMEAALLDLQKIILENGWTEQFRNGENQHCMKKTSEVTIYNAMIKNYTTAMKQLNEMLPDEEVKDNFDSF